MYRGLARLIVVCGALVAIGLTLTVPATARSVALKGSAVEACVLQIADVTGDAVADFSVSFPAVRNGAMVVYLIAGGDQPLPTPLDPSYLRRNLAGVLKGPAAMPFVCPIDAVEPITPIGGPGRVRLRRPIANTLIGQPASYAMVDLDPLMPGYPVGYSSLASGINATGQVVGQFSTPEGERAFVYARGAVRDLGTLGGHFSEANGINRSGRIVGRSLTGAVDNFGFINAAFVFDGAFLENLNLSWSSASAINDAGLIVGEMRFSPGVDRVHAFLYDQGHATDLGSLPPLGDFAYSSAHSINEAGKVVGQSNTFVLGSAFPATRHDAVRAFEYADGAMRDLGSLGARCSPLPGGAERCFENSVATDINNSGTIVGFSSTPTTVRGHAFVSSGGPLQDLGTLGGSASWAYAVNDSGQVVGGFSSADDRYLAPFLYERGVMYDLNDLIVNPSPAMPFAAYDINNFGQIVGNHHLLQPLYQQVAPGRPLAFTSTLKHTFGFAYWVSRGNVGACHAISSRLRLQVKFRDHDGDQGSWIPADVVRNCGHSTDWESVTIPIPREHRGQTGVIRVRVIEAGPDTEPAIYLRQFSME